MLAVLTAGSISAHWDIQRGVGIKEAKRLQHEPHVLSRHDWPVLDARHMRHAKGVPDHAVGVGNGAVLQETHSENRDGSVTAD